METPVKCNICKIFRVARCKRINCEVNLINLSLLLIRDTFSFPPSMQSVEWEARGWAGALILNETRGTIFLKRLVVSLVNLRFEYRTIYLSDNPEVFWQPSTTGRLVYMWSNTENKCIIPPFLQRTCGDKGRNGSQPKGDVTRDDSQRRFWVS